MTILFLKRLNDRFEENFEQLIKEGKSEKQAAQNSIRSKNVDQWVSHSTQQGRINTYTISR